MGFLSLGLQKNYLHGGFPYLAPVLLWNIYDAIAVNRVKFIRSHINSPRANFRFAKMRVQRFLAAYLIMMILSKGWTPTTSCIVGYFHGHKEYGGGDAIPPTTATVFPLLLATTTIFGAAAYTKPRKRLYFFTPE
jgi:hypothetical protein